MPAMNSRVGITQLLAEQVVSDLTGELAFRNSNVDVLRFVDASQPILTVFLRSFLCAVLTDGVTSFMLRMS